MKKLLTSLIILVALASPMTAQRSKPKYDPETKEGLLIQHIQQESDPSEKLHYMEQFALQHPTSSAAAWVYDQLQPAYMKEKAWDEAMRIGQMRVALEPENLEAAKLSLKAAESKGSQDDISKWAECSWKMASQIVAKGGRNAADAVQTQLYAEFDLFNIAQATTDPAKRLDLLTALQERNPKSPYAENIPAERFAIYKKLNQMDKALVLADATLATDPDNLDMLMAVSEYHFGRSDANDRVIRNSVHVIDVLSKKPRPANLSDEDWDKKKSHLLASAYYMGGVASAITGQYGRADQMLRAALPMITGDATQQATALYELGIANYHLADNSPTRARDALGYWRRCSSIKSNFQAQAMKNAESIRAEFNLP